METCGNGHPRTEENTYYWRTKAGRVDRLCKPCRAAWQHKKYLLGETWNQQPENAQRRREIALKHLDGLPRMEYARRRLISRRRRGLQRMAKRHQELEASHSSL